jgi:Zn-finger nucleic acid-binding protein
MRAITCPKCRKKLQSVIYQQIEIDRCVGCAGIWFDSLEAEQLKQLQGSETIDEGIPSSEVECDALRQGERQRHEKELRCPQCSVKMMQILDIDVYTLWYEKCIKCLGVWLDAGEFRKFKQNFRNNKVFEQTVRSFRSNKV